MSKYSQISIQFYFINFPQKSDCFSAEKGENKTYNKTSMISILQTCLIQRLDVWNDFTILLQTVLDEATTAWGIKVERVEM